MLKRRLFLLAASAFSVQPRLAGASGQKIVVTPASALDGEELDRHERYMQMAIDAVDGGPPFGAVIVDHERDEVVCTGRNRGGSNRIYHGEMDAMINCGHEHPQIDWTKLTLYTTGEPCPMCMSGIIWNRLPRVVYATSIKDLTEMGLNQIGLDSPTVAAAAPFYSGEIVSGLLSEKTDKIFKDWRSSRSR